MNVYDDYESFMQDYNDLYKKLKETDSPILVVIQDVLRVLDYVYEQYLNGDKIEEDLVDIFEIGFSFISNVFSEINIYYQDYFNSNYDIFNYYAKLICYLIYVDDFKWYLDNEDYLTKERRKVIDEVKDEIEQTMKNRLPYTDELMQKLENKISGIMPYHDKFQPVYAVFLRITEELNIF